VKTSAEPPIACPDRLDENRVVRRGAVRTPHRDDAGETVPRSSVRWTGTAPTRRGRVHQRP